MSGAALAQPAEPDPAVLAEARRLFTEGVAHTQAQRWTEATTSFRAALELHAAPTIRYNLAAALVELGHHREATEQIDRVLADAETPPNIAELSRALSERIRRETAMLTIAIEGEAEGAGVVLDSEPLEPAWLAREIPVAPGAHTVSAVRDGQTVAEVEVTAAAGQTSRVRLVVPAPGAPPIVGGGDPPLHEDWRLWVGVGAAGAVIVAIIVVIAVAAQPGPPLDPVPGNFMPQVITW